MGFAGVVSDCVRRTVSSVRGLLGSLFVSPPITMSTNTTTNKKNRPPCPPAARSSVSVTSTHELSEPSEAPASSEMSYSCGDDDANSEMSFASAALGPSEVVIITTTHGNYYTSTTVVDNLANPNSSHNKVVSSNPTLNLLLSQPIVTSAQGVSLTAAAHVSNTTTTSNNNIVIHQAVVPPPASLKRSKNSSTSSSSKKLCTTKAPAKRVDSPKPPTATLPKKEVSYIPEIRKMMHSFGDVKSPLVESAKLIEQIVKSQLEMLIFEAQDLALGRGSSCIGLEEFLFLLRNDVHKLSRAVRFLQFKDIRSKLSNTSGFTSNKENSDNDHITTSKSTDLEEFFTDFESSKPEAFLSGNCQTKRVRLCYNFLAEIDTPAGKFASIFCEDSQPDPITLARNHRLNEFTTRMSVKDYLYYQSCRSVSFAGNATTGGASSATSSVSSKFQEWMLSPQSRPLLKLKLNGLALEILQHLAHETVAILVELALLIQADTSRSSQTIAPDDEPTTGLAVHERTRFTTGSPKEHKSYRETMEQYREQYTCQYFGVKYNKSDKQQQHQQPTPAQHKEAVCPETKKLVTDVLTSAAEACARLHTNGTYSKHSVVDENRWARPITPAELLEAMRRFEAAPTMFAPFARVGSGFVSRRKRILCI